MAIGGPPRHPEWKLPSPSISKPSLVASSGSCPRAAAPGQSMGRRISGGAIRWDAWALTLPASAAHGALFLSRAASALAKISAFLSEEHRLGVRARPQVESCRLRRPALGSPIQGRSRRWAGSQRMDVPQGGCVGPAGPREDTITTYNQPAGANPRLRGTFSSRWTPPGPPTNPGRGSGERDRAAISVSRPNPVREGAPELAPQRQGDFQSVFPDHGRNDQDERRRRRNAVRICRGVLSTWTAGFRAWASMPQSDAADYGHACGCGFPERCRREKFNSIVARFKQSQTLGEPLASSNGLVANRPVDTETRESRGQRWCHEW